MPDWPRKEVATEITKNDLDSKFFEFEKRMDEINVRFNKIIDLINNLRSLMFVSIAVIIVLQLILFVEVMLWR